jgi:dienelactone hydrolase
MPNVHQPDGPERPAEIPVGRVTLEGSLGIPAGAQGIVVFAHGSGSSRHSPRNRYVAQVLRAGGLATLLIDLLTPAEETVDQVTAHLRFDISMLADRLVNATDWLSHKANTRHLAIAYFGASTGAAAALVAAAKRPGAVAAIVSRGGRPDLAGDALAQVQAPTLLIVGGRDKQVLERNQDALARLQVAKQLDVVPDATHLFEEPGALEQVAHLARDWFVRYLTMPAPGALHVDKHAEPHPTM